MCGAPLGHEVARLATSGPSQYCVIVPDQRSVPVPRPFMSRCMYGAPWEGSWLNVRFPPVPVVAVPHWVPQKTRYTLGFALVTPMPSIPPPKDMVFGPVVVAAAAGLAWSYCCI